MKNIKLVISILISLGVGFIAGSLIKNNVDIYSYLNQPPLAPPKIIFPIIWTILYILMGISSYLIYQSNDKNKYHSLKTYSIQLIVNFFWSIIFFNFQNYLFAFIWILLLIVLISYMISQFYKINKYAAYLQIPYFIWSLFAAYLNLGIYLLNK